MLSTKRLLFVQCLNRTLTPRRSSNAAYDATSTNLAATAEAGNTYIRMGQMQYLPYVLAIVTTIVIVDVVNVEFRKKRCILTSTHTALPPVHAKTTTETVRHTLWTPVTDALGKSGDLLNIIFHKPEGQLKSPDTTKPSIVGSIDSTAVTTQSASQWDSSSSGARLIAMTDGYGVAQLELEGDPSCDYTTKVRIAGSEYNVIIDTGSAHFAVGSSACQDCVIPRKDRYRPNDEEIPVDGDTASQDDEISSGSGTEARTSDQEPLNLPKQDPKSTMQIDETSAAATASLMTDIVRTTTTLARTATTFRDDISALTRVSNAIAPAATANPPVTATSLHYFSEAKMRLEAMKSSLLALLVPAPTSIVSSLPSNSIPADVFNYTNVSISSHYKPTLASGVVSSPLALTGNSHHNNTLQVDRQLAAAPAENLYPLSEISRLAGQTVRVSYGISSHSVGWSGVMTSDLMTLELAKVILKDTSLFSFSPAPESLPGTTTEPLTAGVMMEKETSVEFAAIVENSGFFSQECGAQHGIWGLGYKSLSVDERPTLFDTLSASMKIPNGFALQLCGRTSNTTKSGNMFLGGYSTTHIAEPMQFVPLVKKDWYQVQLEGFRVMGEPVEGMQNLNKPKSIVDSGTTNIMMSHYNLQFLIRSLAQSSVVRWSNRISQEDINNFWFKNAVLRLPRSTFQVDTAARAVEAVISGVGVPIYTASFLKIRPAPQGQAHEDYVDFYWHGFSSSTAPDAIAQEEASGGAVMPGSVGTILGETLFTGKVVYFERGNDNAQPGDADYGRIGFARGKNCFAPADHASVDVLASEGRVAVAKGLGPAHEVAAGSDINSYAHVDWDTHRVHDHGSENTRNKSSIGSSSRNRDKGALPSSAASSISFRAIAGLGLCLISRLVLGLIIAMAASLL
ncbi:Beta-secretase 2 [Mortierella claussenii]|nr:Beta-secretase 2 [Mortierella claussenii]